MFDAICYRFLLLNLFSFHVDMVYKIRRKTVQKPNNNNNNNINHDNNCDNLGVVHSQSGSTSHISGRIGIQLEPLVFEERGNVEYPERNTSGSRGENQQKTHDSHIRIGFEPGPHPWGASALTTAHAPLLSINRKTVVYSEARSH